MKSFRTELELQPEKDGWVTIEKDIAHLAEKIAQFREGKTDPEKFRSLRLARGVYGQRQQGVQMVRIKVPGGKLTFAQIERLAELSEEYSTGNLHLTTRQDVQFHFVSLERTPQLWEALERDQLTLREACGNTVRNITVSVLAGIDAEEPFDVSPYADALFRHFLRNPVQQDLGRKIKISFSSSDRDTAISFIHDLGFIPKVEIVNGKIVRGFKVLLGGGLGAQPQAAQVAFEFLPADELISFSEALIRVFDRHGERNNRQKARLKFLVAKIGLEELLRLTEQERIAVGFRKLEITPRTLEIPAVPEHAFTTFRVTNQQEYLQWKNNNTFEQKQKDWFGVYVKVPQGNISSAHIVKLVSIAKKYAADDVRVTIGQSLLLRFVHTSALPALYRELAAHDFISIGANAFADITSCPGTDTCNLGISNSTGVAAALEKVITEEYPQLAGSVDLSIKISGCMNSCGQHAIASIGFHGSSMKFGNAVVPALQLLLGGGISGNGSGNIADKILKFPSKRAPAVLRTLLSDFQNNNAGNISFADYYALKGKDYFYQLLRGFSSVEGITEEELIDWGTEQKFVTQIGVGECAGVKVDLIATLLLEAEEALLYAEENMLHGRNADSIYKTYNALVQLAKALLLKKGILVNTQIGIISDFDKHFNVREIIPVSFRELVEQINKTEPTSAFADKYYNEARLVFKSINTLEQQIVNQLNPQLN
jgi:sulfite reductase (ferredoxin)